MSLTKEDLQAIKGIFDERFDKLDGRMGELEGHMGELEGHMGKLEEQVSELEEQVSELKENVNSLNTEVKEVKDRVTRIEVVQLENYLIPKVEEIAAYQKSVYERYAKGADRFEDKITLIDTTSQVVVEHSKQIRELQEKMA